MAKRTFRVKPLAAGLKTSRNPTLLQDGETPRCRNIDFSRDSILGSRGSVKLGNQVAPEPALRTRIDPAYSPLSVAAGKSAPLRGYVYYPYDPDEDIGGDFAASGVFPAQTFHARRGKSFELNVSVRIPDTFRMYARGQKGAGAPASGIAFLEDNAAYDEGLDDCCLILQKGGDRMSPMSWALGIVNTGNWEHWTGLGTLPRKSNYCFVFMWLDAAEWAEGNQTNMRYHMTNPSQAGVSGQYSTQALRAIILDGRGATHGFFIEAGRSYNIALSVQLDSAAVGGTAWNHDGRIDFNVQEEHGERWVGSFVDSGGGGTQSNLNVWKGPTDSFRYLCKYGIRYSGKDATFAGLGYRLAPWNEQGFIPYGMDSAAMEKRGFRMADRSASLHDDFYGIGAYTLTCTHPVAGNPYVNVNAHRALVIANANFSQPPTGVLGSLWAGYGAGNSGAPATDFNSEALRGYRAVFPGKGHVSANFNGAVFSITTYTENGGADFRLNLTGIDSVATTWAAERAFFVQAFRWNQQELEIQERRIYTSRRSYTAPRTVFSLRSSVALDDETEPDLAKLTTYSPMNDGHGRVVRELIGGRDGFLAPFGMGLSEQGSKGKNSLFLSGEGEALVFDLSENPVFAREMAQLLSSNKMGFAIELSLTIPEAAYGVAIDDAARPTDRRLEAAYCPDIATWSVKDADEAGPAAGAAPLLVFGHHSFWSLAATTQSERRPQGFQLDYHAGLDQESSAMSTAFIGGTKVASPLWDDQAPWVGQRITVQFGVQPSAANRAGTAGFQNEYRIYLAASPKQLFRFAQGDPQGCEFAYFVDRVIQKKELLRLVVTVGGGWNPLRARGYTEYRSRLIVDEVRVYAATAPGELPAVSGNVTPTKRGKIQGENALPQRALELADMLMPLGPGTKSLSLVDGTITQNAAGGTSLFTANPEDTRDAIRERYMRPTADTHEKPSEDQYVEIQEDFYWIRTVAATGATLELATAYDGASAPNAGAACFNLAGYLSFDEATDDLRRAPLSIGSGTPYRPGVTRTKDLVLSGELFKNAGPVTGTWRAAIASPFTQGGLATILPAWCRGVVSPRRSPIRAVHGLDDTIFASNRGSIFRVDDRWREDGPTRALRRSLAILGREGVPGMPLVRDVVRFPNYSNVWPYWSTDLYLDQTWVYDAWVKIDRYSELQTIMWLGCEHAHFQKGPATVNDQRGTGIWWRLADGYPELVRESQGNFFGGADPPEDGEYVARGATRVPLGRWTHLRVYLDHYLNGLTNTLRIPGMTVNGRRCRVSINAKEDPLPGATDWIQASNGGGLIGSAGDDRNALYIGAARDAYRTISKDRTSALNQLVGQEVRPGRVFGMMHPLNGQIAGFVVWRESSTDPLVSGFPNFDPHQLDYTGLPVRMLVAFQAGVGHQVEDMGTEILPGFDTTIPGVIHGHPCIDLWNEFGAGEDPHSTVTYGQRVYFASGGRPAYVEQSKGGPAGILPPTTRPSFRVERFPLWEANTPDDPVADATAGGTPIHHYNTIGNNYLTQRFHDDMRWAKDETNFDVLAVKGMWQPRDVAGVLPIYSARGSTDSGGLSLECVDGKLRLGWYDVQLKKRVWVETSSPVVRAGVWSYFYARKSFPLNDPSEGNWLNSFFSNGRRRRAVFAPGVGTIDVGDIIRNGGATKRGLVTKVTTTHIEYILFEGHVDFVNPEAVNDGAGNTGTISSVPHHLTGDGLVFREFVKVGTTALDGPPWQAKPTPRRTCIPFTSGMPRVTGTTALGQVTPKGVIYDGAAGGSVTIDAATTNVLIFHDDHRYMYWQWASSTGDPKVYRVVGVNTGVNAIIVQDEFGVAPSFAGAQYQNAEGAIFSGVELLKSEGFDLSKSPDQSVHDVEFMGSALARYPGQGLARLRARYASFGWTVVGSTLANRYQNVEVFETNAAPLDDIELGGDIFANFVYPFATPVGELHFDASPATFAVVDGQPYAGATPSSTQPNEELRVDMDTQADTDAEPCFWRFLQPVSEQTGRRKIAVCFFDVDQDQVSNPGPMLEIDPPAEDRANPSGLTRYVLEDLPISPQPGTIERWIYATRPGGAVGIRRAIVPDNHSGTFGLDLDDTKVPEEGAEFLEEDNAAPPDCSVIGTSQSALFYGDISEDGFRQRDVLRHSKPTFPVSVPKDNLVAFVEGQDEPVTAMATLKGRLIVWKRSSMHEVVLRDGPAFASPKSTSNGCVGPQALAVLDDAVLFVSNDRGTYVYAGDGGLLWLSDSVEDLFAADSEGAAEVEVDPDRLRFASATVFRSQDQFVVAFQAFSDRDPRRRISTEIGERVRHSLYAEPRLSALAAVDRSNAGRRRAVGGTVEGFLVYLDRADTQVHLAKESAELWNPVQVTIDAASTAVRFILEGGPIDYLETLEGVRGARLAWREADGTPRDAHALFSDGLSIYLDREADAIPPEGTVVSIGAIEHVWESKWFDLGNPHQKKVTGYLDLTLSPGVGTAVVELFGDNFDENPHPLIAEDGQLLAEVPIDLATEFLKRIPLGEMRAQFFKFRIRTVPPTVGQRLEVIEATISEIQDVGLHSSSSLAPGAPGGPPSPPGGGFPHTEPGGPVRPAL